LWITLGILICAAAVLYYSLLRAKSAAHLPTSLSVADLTGVISLALSAAIFFLTIVSLAIAVAAFKASERSGEQQQKTLDESRSALQRTANTLDASTKHFQESAEAAMGQYNLAQTERKEREEAVRIALAEELNFNERAVAENGKNLQSELHVLKERRSLIVPLQTLHTGAWELLRVYIPPELTATPSTLTHVATVYRITLRVNEVLRSREDYRIHNGAMSNYHEQMQAYDEQLLLLNGELTGILPSIARLVESSKGKTH